MYKIILFLSCIYLLVFYPFAATSANTESLDGLKSRRLIGVIYFNGDSVELSKVQQAEICRIASLIVSQCSSDKIVRVEGFTTKNDPFSTLLPTSFSRANAVWTFLEEMNSFDSSNLFLTGFSAQQSISKLQGERVEIAVYDISFNE